MINFQSIQICVLQAIFVGFASLTQRVGLASGEEGQGLSEYMLLVSLLVGLVVSTMSLYTSPLATFYDTLMTSFHIIFSGATL